MPEKQQEKAVNEILGEEGSEQRPYSFYGDAYMVGSRAARANAAERSPKKDFFVAFKGVEFHVILTPKASLTSEKVHVSYRAIKNEDTDKYQHQELSETDDSTAAAYRFELFMGILDEVTR